MSQEEVAARAGVSRSLIQSIENGRRPPRRSNLRKIATALGTDLETLMGDDEQEVPRSNVIDARNKLLEALEMDDPQAMRAAMIAALAQLESEE
jgi:transcriptional regulator with XRE-family HTH domain